MGSAACRTVERVAVSDTEADSCASSVVEERASWMRVDEAMTDRRVSIDSVAVIAVRDTLERVVERRVIYYGIDSERNDRRRSAATAETSAQTESAAQTHTSAALREQKRSEGPNGWRRLLGGVAALAAAMAALFIVGRRER